MKLWAVLRGVDRLWEVLQTLDGFVMLWEALALEGFGKLLKSLGRLWLQHRMCPTDALEGFGKLWELAGGFWKLWEALGGFGMLRKALEGVGSFGRCWQALEGFGKLWQPL